MYLLFVEKQLFFLSSQYNKTYSVHAAPRRRPRGVIHLVPIAGKTGRRVHASSRTAIVHKRVVYRPTYRVIRGTTEVTTVVFKHEFGDKKKERKIIAKSVRFFKNFLNSERNGECMVLTMMFSLFFCGKHFFR